MQNTLKTIALSAAALCATAAFAANQSRVEVPFSFTAQGQSYPAGSYDVVTDSNYNFVTMTSKMDPAKHISWSTGPADAAKTPVVVKFNEVGADHSLKSIQYGSRVTPNLKAPSKQGISATTSIGGQ